MKKFKGIIFDFNGTLILDDEKHKAGWERFCREEGLPFSEETYFSKMHGATNDSIYEVIYGTPVPPELKGVFGLKKEEYYREFLKQDPAPMARGAKELIDFLCQNGIPHAIATSSEINNVNHFCEVYGLRDLFGDNIVYDDGTVRGKPNPDIYLKAGAKLGIPMEDLVTVEDSRSGAAACRAAGAGLVVGISPRGVDEFIGREFADMVITDFTELDYKNLF